MTPLAWVSARDSSSRRVYLDSLGTVSGLSWSSTYPGGDASASCTLVVDPNLYSEALVPGASFGVTLGVLDVFGPGYLTTPGVSRDGRQIGATGKAAELKHFAAVAPTTGNAYALAEVIDAALTRGLSIVRGTLPATPTGMTAATGSVTLAEALDAVTLGNGERWVVRDGVLLAEATPPAKVLRAVLREDPGRTVDTYATAVVVLYLNSGAGGAAAAVVVQGGSQGKGQREVTLDLTDKGAFTTGNATTFGQNYLARLNTRTAFAGRMELAQGDVYDGTNPVDNRLLRAGQQLSLEVANPDRQGEVFGTSVVVTAGEWQVDGLTGTAALTPLETDPDDLAEALTRVRS